jgi:hypothetical protein
MGGARSCVNNVSDGWMDGMMGLRIHESRGREHKYHVPVPQLACNQLNIIYEVKKKT